MNRDKWLHLRLTTNELALIAKNHSQTTHTKLSDYCRDILLGKPMIKAYRDMGIDALITEFSALNKILNGVANNYNQALHKLHLLPDDTQVKGWFIAHEIDRRKLLSDIENIKNFIGKHAEKWLQS